MVFAECERFAPKSANIRQSPLVSDQLLLVCTFYCDTGMYLVGANEWTILTQIRISKNVFYVKYGRDGFVDEKIISFGFITTCGHKSRLLGDRIGYAMVT